MEHRFFHPSRPFLSKETSLAAFLRFSIPLLPYDSRGIPARAARFQRRGIHSVTGISLVALAFSGHFARAKCSRNLAYPPLVLNGSLVQRARPSIRAFLLDASNSFLCSAPSVLANFLIILRNNLLFVKKGKKQKGKILKISFSCDEYSVNDLETIIGMVDPKKRWRNKRWRFSRL